MRFKDKVALITAVGSGIGRATADIMAKEGAVIIGVDNDDVLCNLCVPSLTSIEPDTELLGYEAAALLDRLTHHCSIHEFDWESIRFTDSLRNNKLKKKPGHRPDAEAAS